MYMPIQQSSSQSHFIVGDTLLLVITAMLQIIVNSTVTHLTHGVDFKL